MPERGIGTIRLLLIGAPNSEFGLAAIMARDAGAEVVTADTLSAAMAVMRTDGADLAMIDVAADVAGFITQLRAERIALPVYACGVDAPASQAVAAIRAGARDYLPMPPDRDLIAAAIVSVAGNARVVIGNDAAVTRAVSLGVAVAHARTPLLIVGEPGTGRELLARTIHAVSGRSGRFVAIDCADIDPAMIESELFGHATGAFPGAVADRTGRIDGAAQGTIFLGEVALLPMAVQARLANHLDDEARQSGSRPMTARLIASTAFDLDARAINGSFRASLLARLGLVRLALPPLRDRGPDLSLIATHLAHFFAAAEDLPLRDFTDGAMAQLCRHDWPGNIRELEDVVHRAVLISQDAAIPASALMCADGRPIGRSALHPPQLPGLSRNGWPENFGGLVGSTVEDVERTLILETLKACRGNRTSASSILGISVRTMRNKLKTFVEAGMTVAPVS